MALPIEIKNQHSQLAQLCRRLELWPVINRKELHRMGMDTARIRELRGKLKPYGITIACRRSPVDPGNRIYEVKKWLEER